MLTKNLHVENSVTNIHTTGPSLDGKGHGFSISQIIVVFNDRFQAFKFFKARLPLAQCTTPRNVTTWLRRPEIPQGHTESHYQGHNKMGLRLFKGYSDPLD